MKTEEQKKKHRDYMREYHRANPEANRAKVRAWIRAHPSRKRASNLRVKYGLTVEQYTEMLAAQEHRCAICKTADPGKKGWCVDHCHATLKVRGILCQNCNFVLGHGKDDPLRLRLAAAYLERTT